MTNADRNTLILTGLNFMIKEFFAILLSFDIEKIFRGPTKNGLLQFFRYGFVGAIATAVDWALLYLLEMMGLDYLLAAVVGFVAGLTVNFILSKMFVFAAEKANASAAGEFIIYGVIGVIGLGMTEVIMYYFTDKLSLYFMLSKVIATLVVFIWNFAARKLILYRGK